jgi:hypothetical protein
MHFSSNSIDHLPTHYVVDVPLIVNFFINFAKIQRKNLKHFWVLIIPSRSRANRSGFYPAAAAVKKVAAKPQSQPPGKNSTAEMSSSTVHIQV